VICELFLIWAIFVGLFFALFRGITAMTDWPESDELRHSISARLIDMSRSGPKDGARPLGGRASNAMAWRGLDASRSNAT